MITRYLHIKKFVGFLFLLLATAACSNEDEAVVMPSSNESIKLQVTTEENALTRSDGVDNLNENRFVTLDYFFFESMDETSELLLVKSETGLENEKRSHTYNGRFSDEDLQKVFGEDSGTDDAKRYVYVVANLNKDALLEESKTTILDDEGNFKTGITLGTLMKAKFQTPGISNGIQDSFVMYGGDYVTLKITSSGSVTKKSLEGEIFVARDAAKVVLTVDKVEEIVSLGEQKWKSDNENMHVMFYNGVNKSTIHSMINVGYHYKPTNSADDCYFTLDGMEDDSPNPWRKLEGSGNTNRTHSIPFYTYLSVWGSGHQYEGIKDRPSYMILMVPWYTVNEDGTEMDPGDDRFLYKYTYYQIETTPYKEYWYYENYHYQINITVSVLGSFEIPEPVKVQAKYMVVPWGTIDVPGSLREGKYLILETDKYEINNEPSGSIPYISSHAITEAYVTQVKFKQYSTNTGMSSYSYVDVTRPNNPAQNQRLDNEFVTNTFTFYIPNTDGNRIQSTSTLSEQKFKVTHDDGKLTLHHTINNKQFAKYEVTVRITNAAGLTQDVLFTIYPAIYFELIQGDNAFINGRFGHVSNPPGNTTQQVNPAWRSNGGYSWSSNTNNNTPPNYVDTGNGFGSLETNLGANQLHELTKITISSFSTGNTFKIRYNNEAAASAQEKSYVLADPRVVSNLNTRLSNQTYNYWVTAESNRQNQTNASWSNSTIMKGSDRSDVIAPQLIISSAWGRTQGMRGRTFDHSEMRCATYQEAGYPAGRWRLPTEAELAFIYNLQNQGVIPILFKSVANNPYWASSGNAINGNGYDRNNDVHHFVTQDYTGGPNMSTLAVDGGQVGLRCVYDSWYWGEDPVKPINEYHAMP